MRAEYSRVNSDGHHKGRQGSSRLDSVSFLFAYVCISKPVSSVSSTVFALLNNDKQQPAKLLNTKAMEIKLTLSVDGAKKSVNRREDHVNQATQLNLFRGSQNNIK